MITNKFKDRLGYFRKLFLMKAKFAMSGLVATSIDYVLYLVLVDRIFSPVVSNIVSYSVAVVVNFLLQKRFVFEQKRSTSQAFIGAMLVSLGGLLISTGLIYWLSGYPFFAERQYLAKLLVTGTVFFYNFYFKRFAFERRFFSMD